MRKAGDRRLETGGWRRNGSHVDAGADATILSTCSANGEIAALVATFGAGRVAVSGPHPEASWGWYEDSMATHRHS
jgi:hypothetical protein